MRDQTSPIYTQGHATAGSAPPAGQPRTTPEQTPGPNDHDDGLVHGHAWAVSEPENKAHKRH
jgi:hypothetical protein